MVNVSDGISALKDVIIVLPEATLLLTPTEIPSCVTVQEEALPPLNVHPDGRVNKIWSVFTRAISNLAIATVTEPVTPVLAVCGVIVLLTPPNAPGVMADSTPDVVWSLIMPPVSV